MKEYTVEDSCFGFIKMKNGATILLETSWALNTAEPVEEGSCVLCGSKAGLSLKNNKLVINKVELGRQVKTEVDCAAGGVAFYDGVKVTPPITEQMRWYDDHPPTTPR